MNKKKRTRQQQEVKPDETKSEKFVRVVTPRIHKAVKSIDLLCNCAGSNYEYTLEQVEQITQALFASVNRVVDAYSVKRHKQDVFEFKA